MTFLRILPKSCCVLLAAALLTSTYVGFISPENVWVLAAVGLAFPWLLLFNIVLLITVMIMARRVVWIPLLALVLSWPTLMLHLRLQQPSQSPSADDIKLVCYNVRNFDLYNWSQEGVQLEKILKLIASEKPDIACFQEFFNADTGAFRTVERLQEQCRLPYVALDKTVERPNYGAWGLATFSRYPIFYQRSIRFGQHTFNSALLSGVRIGTDTLWILNVHLQSIALEDPDYAYLKQIGSEMTFDLKPTQSIARKLRQGYRTRPEQARQLRRLVDSLDGPLVLCGDFNDTPGSYVYRRLSGPLRDAFLLAGSPGFGRTHAGTIPLLRIDYVMVNDRLNPVQFRINGRKLSDHYLLATHIRLKR